MSAPKSAKPPSLIRSSFLFGSLTMISRLMGFVRDLAITRVLGASGTIAADAYYTALAFPNLFRRIFAEGAFAAAFVPAYSKKLAGDGDAEADRMASDALATVAFASVALSLICMLAMPWIMHVYANGYLDNPAKFRLTWMLSVVTMPYLSCMVIASVFSGILNARGRFVVSGLYPTILNVVMLAMVWPQTDPVSAAWAAAWGVIIAGVGQFSLCWWGAWKSGARIRLVRPKLTPEMKALIRTAIPAIVGNSATQINITISMAVASQVDGLRSWMNVADRLYQLPLTLAGVAVGIALLPRLSQAIRTDDTADARSAMDQALVFALALSLPAAAALVAIPERLMDGLFTRGEFTIADAKATGALLFHYGWGVPAFVILRVLQPVFFARGDTRTPMTYSLISVATNIVIGVGLFYSIGFTGLAIGTSAAAWINVAQLVWKIHSDKIYDPSKRAVGKIIRVTISSALLGLTLLVLRHYYSPIERLFADVRFPGFTAKEITILLISLLGMGIYPVYLFALGGVTPAEAKAALRRKKAAPADLPPDGPDGISQP